MGVYACNKCFEKYHLNEGNGINHVGICEICADKSNDYTSYEWVLFTHDITRYFPSSDSLNMRIKEQLEAHLKQITEKI